MSSSMSVSEKVWRGGGDAAGEWWGDGDGDLKKFDLMIVQYRKETEVSGE